jgi:fatty-acid desaturase
MGIKMSRRLNAEGANAVEGRVVPDFGKSVWVVGMGLAGLSALVLSSWDPAHIAVAVALTALSLCCGHSVGLHRVVIHRAARLPRWLEYGLVWLAVVAGIGGPLSLVRHHELRDWAQRAQRESHPWLGHQQPFVKDLPQQVAWRIELAHPPEIVLEDALRRDPFYRLLEASWPLQNLPIALAAWIWGGWEALAWIVGMRVFLSVVMHQVVGWLAHNVGEQHEVASDASVQGFNLPVLGFLSFGEGWHNNHHAHPGSARLGLAVGEWDPGWWFVVALRGLGLAHDVVEARLEVPGRSAA